LLGSFNQTFPHWVEVYVIQPLAKLLRMPHEAVPEFVLPAAPFRTDHWPGITESQQPY